MKFPNNLNNTNKKLIMKNKKVKVNLKIIKKKWKIKKNVSFKRLKIE